MTRNRFPFLTKCVFVAMIGSLFLSLPVYGTVDSSKMTKHEVWAVYFGSSDCPVCEHIGPLLKSLMDEYGLKVRCYDITRPDDYMVFERIESVHGDGKFSVPMVIIGEHLLVGEKQIQSNLRKLVDKYRNGSGSPLPYLGDTQNAHSTERPKDPDCPDCRDKGRPPPIRSELKKLKVIIDKLLE